MRASRAGRLVELHYGVEAVAVVVGTLIFLTRGPTHSLLISILTLVHLGMPEGPVAVLDRTVTIIMGVGRHRQHMDMAELRRTDITMDHSHPMNTITGHLRSMIMLLHRPQTGFTEARPHQSMATTTVLRDLLRVTIHLIARIMGITDDKMDITVVEAVDEGRP